MISPSTRLFKCCLFSWEIFPLSSFHPYQNYSYSSPNFHLHMMSAGKPFFTIPLTTTKLRKFPLSYATSDHIPSLQGTHRKFNIMHLRLLSHCLSLSDFDVKWYISLLCIIASTMSSSNLVYITVHQ